MRRKSHSLDTQHHSYIKSVDTIDLMRTRDTHNCPSIDLASLLCVDEKVCDGWNKGEPIADDKILVV